MSSRRSRARRSSSMFCDAVTAKGTNCRNYHMKGDKFCYVHKSKQSKLIVHTAPVVQFEEIVFANHFLPSEHTCTFKNKFGELICSNSRTQNKFCEEHHQLLLPFAKTLGKLVDLVPVYKQSHYTLDSYFKLLGNIAAFMIKHKHNVVHFGLGDMVNNMINHMIDHNITKLLRGNFVSSLTYHRGSKPFGFYINMLFKLRKELITIREHIQIDIARDTLVSNNIKINKLTEICLKKEETSTEITPVFCKGIDKHILKFIV